MRQYRCYFLNAASRIIGAQAYHSEDAAGALREARAHLADHEYRAAAEVWQEEEYIGCVLRSDATDAGVTYPVEQTLYDRVAKCPLPRKAS